MLKKKLSNNGPSKTWYGKQKPAFMLIEIMIAFAVMCLAISIITQYQWRIIQNGQLARDTARATVLASNRLEELLRSPNTLTPSKRMVEQFEIVHECKAIEMPIHAQYQLSQKFLTKVASVCITVSWRDRQSVVHCATLYSVIPMVEV